MAGTLEKIYLDPEIGEVVLRKSVRARRMSLRVHPVKGVSVTMPYKVPYMVAMAFFKLKRAWVKETMDRQKARAASVPELTARQIEELGSQARKELPSRLSELADRYGFTYNKVTIKHNSSNWGSCSTKNNINLNLKVMRLPAVLRDYVLLHELCHLRHHDHGHAFHLLLEHVLTDNLVRSMDAGVPEAGILAKKIAVSKAKYPADHTMTAEIRRCGF